MAVQDYKINYKSDFVLTINGDAGWAIPFCIKFWTGMPSQAYFVGFDGVKYVNCRVGDTPTQLLVMFDDHHLPIGPLKMQIAYHTTIEEFPGSVFDEVTNARDVIVTIDGTDYQVLLDFTGEDAPELEFDLPAYANEAERIENELQRQQNEEGRVEAELQREQEFETLKNEVDGLKTDAQEAIETANNASRIANTAADNANAKATEAETAAGNANDAAVQAVNIADAAASRAVGIANEAATRAESIANAAAQVANTAASNADAKAAEAEQAAEGANNVDAEANGTVITVTNRSGVSKTIDVNDVMLALIGINDILDDINGKVI